MIALLIPQAPLRSPEEHPRPRLVRRAGDCQVPHRERSLGPGPARYPADHELRDLVVARGSPVREVEDADDQQHRVVGGLERRSGPARRRGRSRPGRAASPPRTRAAGRRRAPLGSAANSSVSAGSRKAWMPQPTRPARRCTVSPNTSTRQISPQRSGSILQSDQPGREHRPRTDPARQLDLEVSEVRREAPDRRLLLAYGQPFGERLLAEGAADRARPVAGLHRRDPQRRPVPVRTPQPLIGRDAQPESGRGDRERRRRSGARAPGRQVAGGPDARVEVVAGEALVDPVGPVLCATGHLAR